MNALITSLVVLGQVVLGEPDETVMLEPAGTTLEFINLDPTARKVTVLADHGRKRVFAVDEEALVSLTDVQPEQKVFLSYRFGADGKTEAVVRVTPASDLPTVRVESGRAAEVVSADPSASTLTIRGEGGESRTLVVHERAVPLLEGVRVGDRVFVTGEGGRVSVVVFAPSPHDAGAHRRQ